MTEDQISVEAVAPSPKTIFRFRLAFYAAVFCPLLLTLYFPRTGFALMLIAGPVAAKLGRLGQFRFRPLVLLASAALFISGLVGSAGALLLGMLGGMWGRPLRIKGKVVHPDLKRGAEWAHGLMPDVSGLDEATRRALEALWLHDAKKEHASVPAFSRISWGLAAAGAPPELLEGAHRAAIEEVDHARRCFALAAGYGGSPHTVEPMPAMFTGMEFSNDPLSAMAVESLEDGCLLEGFNADVADRCMEACQDAAAKSVLKQIAREERSHAGFSWRALKWLLQVGGDSVRASVERSILTLSTIRRPTAVSSEAFAVVSKADPLKIRLHGRLMDDDWAPLWPIRVEETKRRAMRMLEKSAAAVI